MKSPSIFSGIKKTFLYQCILKSIKADTDLSFRGRYRMIIPANGYIGRALVGFCKFLAGVEVNLMPCIEYCVSSGPAIMENLRQPGSSYSFPAQKVCQRRTYSVRQLFTGIVSHTSYNLLNRNKYKLYTDVFNSWASLWMCDFCRSEVITSLMLQHVHLWQRPGDGEVPVKPEHYEHQPSGQRWTHRWLLTLLKTSGEM